MYFCYMNEKFLQDIGSAYQFKGEAIEVGCAMLDKQVLPQARISLPLRMMNRHGLIAGATGTGKTKTLQLLAENFSKRGIACLLLDIKGDLSGIAMPADRDTRIQQRNEEMQNTWQPSGNFVELLTISSQQGLRLRATVSEFGPVLFSKILGLNDTQESIISLIFKFCDDQGLLLVDLEDLKKVLQHISNEGEEAIEREYGAISSSSTGTILRKIIEIEQQGAGDFFGEPSFEVADLLRRDKEGKGVISILRAVDIQNRPKFFSTFMLQLLAEIYYNLEEAGDLDKPKLVIFLDEAHLLFEEATKALLDQLETMIKLIRSKGVGLFFITQNPVDIPESILAQLGLKIQHALRAFTAKDRKAIKLAAQNYPETEYYNIEQLITELGIGEAFITTLNEKGIPTPLAHTMIRPPESRMDVLTEQEISQIVKNSTLVPYYAKKLDRESAADALKRKWEQTPVSQKSGDKSSKTGRPDRGIVEKVLDNAMTRQIGRTVFREITRGILGKFGLRPTSTRRRSRSGWF